MNLIEQSENLVSKLLKDKLSRSYTYHNFKRTRNVVNAVITFADSEDILYLIREIVVVHLGLMIQDIQKIAK
jgi:hypothetical protein